MVLYKSEIKAMKEQIEHTLRAIAGMPMWSIGRAADLEWFHFGAQRVVTTHKGGIKTVGDYALHVQCAWRIIGPNGIVVASRDRYYPARGHLDEDLSQFDWDKPGVNRCDEQVSIFLGKHTETPLVVEAVEADSVGGFQITLSRGYALQIFPDHSSDGEYWRLFQPSMEQEHFVVTGHGIET